MSNRIRVQFQKHDSDIVASGNVVREGTLTRSHLTEAASKLRDNIRALRDEKLAALALAALGKVLDSSVFDYNRQHSGNLHRSEFYYDGDSYRIDVELYGSYEPQ